MSGLEQGQVATGNNYGEGSQPIQSLGRNGESVATELRGRLFYAGANGRLYHAMPQAALALSLTGTTTYTGPFLYNPAGSGVIGSLEQVRLAVASLAAGLTQVAVFVASAPPSTFTTQVATYPARFQNGASFPASSAGKIQCWTSLTLAAAPAAATAPLVRPIIGHDYSTSASFSDVCVVDEVEGAIQWGPGTGVGLVALTTAVSVLSDLVWEELSSPPF